MKICLNIPNLAGYFKTYVQIGLLGLVYNRFNNQYNLQVVGCRACGVPQHCCFLSALLDFSSNSHIALGTVNIYNVLNFKHITCNFMTILTSLPNCMLCSTTRVM